jgi:hypothetical protein
MKLAVLLFTLDVGVRRIQIDREEWQRAIRVLRRWVFFWQGVPRAPEAEESLAALLTRRDQVRAKQTTTTPPPPPRPDLFTPEKPVTEIPSEGEEPGKPAASAPPPIVEPRKPGDEKEPSSTTSRLLEAKRRAQKRKP